MNLSKAFDPTPFFSFGAFEYARLSVVCGDLIEGWMDIFLLNVGRRFYQIRSRRLVCEYCDVTENLFLYKISRDLNSIWIISDRLSAS